MVKTEIQDVLRRREWSRLRGELSEWRPPEVADLLLELDKPDRVLLFRTLPRDQMAEVFAHLDPGDQDELLAGLTDEETRHLLAELSPDDRTHLLEEMPGEVTQRLLTLLTPADYREARDLLGYPEGSVGRLMTPDYVAVRSDWTVAQALEHVRRRGPDSETIHIVYVTDERGYLHGWIGLRHLILAEPAEPVAHLMKPSVVSIQASQDREEAVRLVERYDLEVLPVVGSDGALLGIVTVDDVLDVAEEEATEDFHKVASVAPLKMSLLDAGIGFLYRRRIGWLLVLVFMNIFSGAGIAFFEETIQATVALVFFLPLLIDSAGNAGSQASTLMVRALATSDVAPRDWLRLLGKELMVALALGVTLAAAVSLVGFVRAPEVAVVVAVSMLVVVMIGSLIGMSLPFLLTRAGLDPATASSPLITSIADIAGVLIYFTLASWYLGL